MSSITDVVRAGQEQFLETVRQSQQAYVDAVGAWAKSVDESSVPTVPGLDTLPSAEEVVENTFDFAEKLLAAQREFTRNLIAAATPAVQRTGKDAQTAAKKTTKAASAS